MKSKKYDAISGLEGNSYVFEFNNNDQGEVGIFATLTEGPTLRGDLKELSAMPLGGTLTL